jgi:hypothetical protein
MYNGANAIEPICSWCGDNGHTKGQCSQVFNGSALNGMERCEYSYRIMDGGKAWW